MKSKGSMISSTQDIRKLLVVPDEDAATPIKDSEAQFIHDFLVSNKIQKTLEVGLAYAKSAAHIIAATENKHIAIDPFQDNYQRLGLTNIDNLGLTNYLDFREDFSHNVLPQLLIEKAKFEFIFIDGDHKFDGEFIDFYYSDLLLESNGFVLLHDTWMRSTRLLMHFIKNNRKDFKKVPTPLRNFALYQKVGKDNRNGMHFKEFYTFKSIVSHNLILWMSSGKNTGLKQLLLRLKDAVK